MYLTELEHEAFLRGRAAGLIPAAVLRHVILISESLIKLSSRFINIQLIFIVFRYAKV